mmetsp:Transcript_30275/g.66230  ORF Transcript_30275/g.66230 Transcript_30275/m.66230 type:complete len:346 (+) Transcript_30275:57-1094(+)
MADTQTMVPADMFNAGAHQAMSLDGQSPMMHWPWRCGEALWEVAQAALAVPCPWSSGVHDALVILDWDDTILPTTALTSAGHVPEMSTEAAFENFGLELVACAEAARRLLDAAKRHGRVVIITNAVHGWVEECVERFMPQLKCELAGIPIISARSIYEPQGMQASQSWKLLCFHRVVSCFAFDREGIKGMRNLVSIGDSFFERMAVMKVAEDLDLPAYVKSLKLIERPSIAEVTCQLLQCSFHFDWLMSYAGSLDLWVQENGYFAVSQPTVQEPQQEEVVQETTYTPTVVEGTLASNEAAACLGALVAEAEVPLCSQIGAVCAGNHVGDALAGAIGCSPVPVGIC